MRAYPIRQCTNERAVVCLEANARQVYWVPDVAHCHSNSRPMVRVLFEGINCIIEIASPKHQNSQPIVYRAVSSLASPKCPNQKLTID